MRPQQRVLLIVTPRSFSTELTCILLSHILISWSQFARICCLFLDEIYINLVLETFNDMLFELHQDKTFCKSVVKVSTNVSIEWFDEWIYLADINSGERINIPSCRVCERITSTRVQGACINSWWNIYSVVKHCSSMLFMNRDYCWVYRCSSLR